VKWAMPWPGAEAAKSAEAAGAAALCSAEFADYNAYVSATEIAHGTSTAMIGPAIAYAFARSPFIHASAARHLDSIAPGRVFLGLGAGTARMNAQWFGVDSSHPASRMAELIEAVRAYLLAENGDRIRFEGQFYNLDAQIRAPVLGALNVPILIGAFNKLMLRTVGAHADGVLGHPLFTDRWWTEVVDPEVARGAARSERSADELARWGWLITAINDEDPARAVADAKRQIAFYLTVKTYDSLVDLHGWRAEVEAIRSEFYKGDPRQIGSHVTDEMLWSIAVCGDKAQARQMLDGRKRLPELGFLSPPGFLVSTRRRDAYSAAITTLGATIAAHSD
jgi:5,10-methylenetetrahydromethanopterin reductase